MTKSQNDKRLLQRCVVKIKENPLVYSDKKEKPSPLHSKEIARRNSKQFLNLTAIFKKVFVN